ncbi:pilus assembly protein TadG-related protein [Agromyces sp. S2-1-8]|uniref:pilus assembly protein TadG-related protein n=1 Tax=Agromyces sp. S2-1-8 TaxID=2897180 RepID=UPI001E3D1792|nr:pilus assembly protein TadG-related protein [Agromyces sp. S2-1-8]MCD5344952.1 pilus assembly protein TadG-related protein [Agromyces sp. S2-1-8]
MRRLIGRSAMKHERGGVAVTVAVAMASLLAVVALVVDVGLLYFEKAELQNGADSAALAVAQECALRPTTCEAGATEMAITYAGDNANDANADATIPAGSFVVNPRSGTVTVDTSTRTQDGSAALNHPLAALIGLDPTSLEATATATWGVPVSGPALALTFGRCEFADHEPTGEDVTGPPINISYDVTDRRHCGPDEDGDGVADVFSRGAFGWVESSNCNIHVDLANPWVPGTSGASGSSSGCTSALLSGYIGQTVLIPLFDDCRDASRPLDPNPRCNGSDVEYHLVAFAAFHITGISVPGVNSGDTSVCGGHCSNKTIQGYFQRYVDLADAYELGEGTEAGLQSVVLAK